MTTKEEFLLDEIQYYEVDPENRRCVRALTGKCVYSPITADKQGLSEGCAIGRKLPEGHAERFDNEEIGAIFYIFHTGNEKVLPEWMLLFGESFLIDCQNLHDNSSYWQHDGLSLGGKHFVKKICMRHDLDTIELKRYFPQP